MLPPKPKMSTTCSLPLSWLCCRPPAYASSTRLKCGSAQHICWLYPGAATIWSKHGQPLGLACREAASGAAFCTALQAPSLRHVSGLCLGIQCAHSTVRNALPVAVCCPCGGTTLTAYAMNTGFMIVSALQGPAVSSAADFSQRHPAAPSSPQQLQGRSSVQQPGECLGLHCKQ